MEEFFSRRLYNVYVEEIESGRSQWLKEEAAMPESAFDRACIAARDLGMRGPIDIIVHKKCSRQSTVFMQRVVS